MARIFTRLAATAACAAALSLAAAPAEARGWHGPHHYRHGGVSGGDVLAGALIIGGIAAIASAANNSNRDRGTDYRYDEPAPYSGYQGRTSGYSGGGIDNAVDMCVGEVERGRDRVSAVDNAARTADGWKISGQLSAGSGFSCWIDNDGRIRNVDVGGQAYDDGSYDNAPYDDGAPYDSGASDAAPAYDGTGPDNRPVWQGASVDRPAAGQWDDDSYARARAEVGYAAN